MNINEGLKQYFQPDFYHFSEDSVLLAKTAASLASLKIEREINGLDLGAGCGVVGLEFVSRLQDKKVLNWTFIENQEEFFPSLVQNIVQLSERTQWNVVKEDLFLHLESQNLHQHYDIILANPPFYTSGRIPLDLKRRRCRFWTKEEWARFLLLTPLKLKTDGFFMFLFRDFMLMDSILSKQNDYFCKLFFPAMGNKVGIGLISHLHIDTDQILPDIRVKNIRK